MSDILISFKAKNKVCTRNVNVTKNKGGANRKTQLTPRGPLHNETIYGSCLEYVTKENEKIGSSFDTERITTVCKKKFRDALARRLEEFGGDHKKAFTGKNSPEKNPIWVDEHHSEQVPAKVRTVTMGQRFTGRKPIDATLKIEKVIDKKDS